MKYDEVKAGVSKDALLTVTLTAEQWTYIAHSAAIGSQVELAGNLMHPRDGYTMTRGLHEIAEVLARASSNPNKLKSWEAFKAGEAENILEIEALLKDVEQEEQDAETFSGAKIN